MEDGWNHPVQQPNQGEPRKLILRAAGSLQLSQVMPLALHRLLSLTAGLTSEEAAGMMTTIEPFKNILIITSDSANAIRKILSVTQLSFNQVNHPVSVYAPAARETCKGVIHQVERGTDPATLQQLLTAPQGYTILSARMMGNTTAAIITFAGTYVPFTVSLGGAVHRCKPHRPKAQICYKCLGLGHRADVCTRSTLIRCPNCGHSNKDEAHTCIIKCVNCLGPHRSDDATCPKKLEADAVVRKQAFLKRLNIRKHATATLERASHRGDLSPLDKEVPSRGPQESRKQLEDPFPTLRREPTPPQHKESRPNKPSPPKKVSQPLSQKHIHRTYRDALTPRTTPTIPIYNSQAYQQHVESQPAPPPSAQPMESTSMDTTSEAREDTAPQNKRTRTENDEAQVPSEEMTRTFQAFMQEMRYEMQLMKQQITEINHTVELRIETHAKELFQPIQQQMHALKVQLDAIMQKLNGQ